MFIIIIIFDHKWHWKTFMDPFFFSDLNGKTTLMPLSLFVFSILAWGLAGGFILVFFPWSPFISPLPASHFATESNKEGEKERERKA